MGIFHSTEHDHRRSLNEENNVDPDDGNSWLCSACTLPIFSTPFKVLQLTNTHGRGGGKLFLHDQCANLPKKLMGHVLHPQQPLFLKDNLRRPQHTSTTNISCKSCKEKCGSMFYQCPDYDCNFRLDLLCALQIKILHRSHEHRLTVIRGGSASFSCGACGTQHQGLSALSYFCRACSFWIHPHCASLPNAIILHAKHHHSLFLTYDLPSTGDDAAGSSTQAYSCALCGGVIQSMGLYICIECRYYAHIRCAVSDPQSFNPVLIRDAKFAGLLHFPLADERTSVMRYIIENRRCSDEADTRDEHYQTEGKLFKEKLHQHPLIFHDQDDIDGGDHPGQSSCVCNACAQFISPPFYSCSQCPDFFLHSCCANLPSKIEHPVHKQHTPHNLASKIEHPVHKQHTLFLFPRAPKTSISYYFCQGCGEQCNGFAYSCNACDFTMDVVCALMPPSITHESHGKTNILYMSHKIGFDVYQRCHCCNLHLDGVRYECSNCRHFKLHAKCALLPKTTRHKFDEHLLKLTTTPKKSVTTDHTVYSKEVQQFCEICEEDILKGRWYYSCNQCDHSFHINCIPFVDHLSRIKFGVTVQINCHNCPLTLIRQSTVYGYGCGYCRETTRYGNELAYECSKCYFRIHDYCANKCLLKG